MHLPKRDELWLREVQACRETAHVQAGGTDVHTDERGCLSFLEEPGHGGVCVLLMCEMRAWCLCAAPLGIQGAGWVRSSASPVRVRGARAPYVSKRLHKGVGLQDTLHERRAGAQVTLGLSPRTPDQI